MTRLLLCVRPRHLASLAAASAPADVTLSQGGERQVTSLSQVTSVLMTSRPDAAQPPGEEEESQSERQHEEYQQLV